MSSSCALTEVGQLALRENDSPLLKQVGGPLGTGTPEDGGLSTRELMELVREIMTYLPVKAVDIVEVSPPLDSANITCWAALKVIYKIFRGAASWKGWTRQ